MKHFLVQIAVFLTVGVTASWLVERFMPHPPMWLSIAILAGFGALIATIAAQDLRRWWRSL